MDRLMMIVLLLIVLITTVSMMLYYKASKKKILITVGVILMIFGTERVYKYIHCGPDRKDISVMKPQAKVVSDYILTHGIPESLAKIPDLVYPLEGCERSEAFKKNSSTVAKSASEANYKTISEKCYFEKDGRRYDIDIRFTDYLTNNPDFGELGLANRTSQTSTGIWFKRKNTNFFIDSDRGYHSYNTNGICAPFRPLENEMRKIFALINPPRFVSRDIQFCRVGESHRLSQIQR